MTRRCWIYGTDKPDLRNPLRITDVTAQFAGSGFGLFARIAAVRRGGAGSPGAGRGRQPAQLLRQAERVGARAGRGRPGLHRLRGRRAEGADRAQPGAGAGRGDPGGVRA